MGRPRRALTREFKREAVKLMTEGGIQPPKLPRILTLPRFTDTPIKEKIVNLEIIMPAGT